MRHCTNSPAGCTELEAPKIELFLVALNLTRVIFPLGVSANTLGIPMAFPSPIKAPLQSVSLIVLLKIALFERS